MEPQLGLGELSIRRKDVDWQTAVANGDKIEVIINFLSLESILRLLLLQGKDFLVVPSTQKVCLDFARTYFVSTFKVFLCQMVALLWKSFYAFLSNLVPHLLSTEKGIFSIAFRSTRLANTTRFASFQVGSLYTYFVPHLMQSIKMLVLMASVSVR